MDCRRCIDMAAGRQCNCLFKKCRPLTFPKQPEAPVPLIETRLAASFDRSEEELWDVQDEQGSVFTCLPVFSDQCVGGVQHLDQVGACTLG